MPDVPLPPHLHARVGDGKKQVSESKWEGKERKGRPESVSVCLSPAAIGPQE